MGGRYTGYATSSGLGLRRMRGRYRAHGRIGVLVGVGVSVTMGVGTYVAVGVDVPVAVGVGVSVVTGVSVAVGIGVSVTMGVGVYVAVGVNVSVGVGVGAVTRAKLVWSIIRPPYSSTVSPSTRYLPSSPPALSQVCVTANTSEEASR